MVTTTTAAAATNKKYNANSYSHDFCLITIVVTAAHIILATNQTASNSVIVISTTYIINIVAVAGTVVLFVSVAIITLSRVICSLSYCVYCCS